MEIQTCHDQSPNRPRLNHGAFHYYSALRRVKEHLDNHIDEEFTLVAAARIARLSETYFSSFFHRKTGMRFRTWVNWVRIRHAANLLAGTDETITRIAQRAGYRDLRTFERAFRRNHSMTPRDYRKRVRPA